MLNAIKDARICKVEDTDSKYTACKNRKSIKEMYNDGEIVSLSEFCAEWIGNWNCISKTLARIRN